VRTIAAITRGATRHRVLGVAAAFAAGLAMALQARINGELAVELHDSLLAALISFGGGLVVLALLLPFSQGMRAGAARIRDAVSVGALRPWFLLGGLGGAFVIFSQSLTVGVLGVATFTVGIVTGQMLSGLLVDRAGLSPGGTRPLSVMRLLGAAMMLLAVVATTWGSFSIAGTKAWLVVVPVLGGVTLAVQQAINGHVGAAAGNSLTATLVNFAGGTAVLAAGWLAAAPLRDGTAALPANPLLYLGGVFGVAFVAIAALVVRWIGVLMLGLAALNGQLLASLLLDALLPASSGGLTVGTVAGAVLAMVAIVVASLRRRDTALPE